jgi:hypothetical protein
MSTISPIHKTNVEHSSFDASTIQNAQNNSRIYQNIFFYFSLIEIIISSLLTIISPFVILSLFMAVMTEGFSNVTFSLHTILFLFFMLALLFYPVGCIASIYVFYKHSKNRDIFCYKQLIESSVAIIYGLLIVGFYCLIWT